MVLGVSAPSKGCYEFTGQEGNLDEGNLDEDVACASVPCASLTADAGWLSIILSLSPSAHSSTLILGSLRAGGRGEEIWRVRRWRRWTANLRG